MSSAESTRPSGAQVTIGRLTLDPSHNPGVLDTATWDRESAWQAVDAVEVSAWPQPGGSGQAGSADAPLTSGASPMVEVDGRLLWLAGLPDGQQVFLEVGSVAQPLLGTPFWSKSLPYSDLLVHAHGASADTIWRYMRLTTSPHLPLALGAIPRLGIGTRMTTAVWPGIWQAMRAGGFAANAVQNSVRELNLLSTLTGALPAEKNVAFGFGMIESGYTGSSWEGLWVAGALNALQHAAPPHGADADHLQIKRGADGLERARRLVQASYRYSFFTFDASDVLAYDALSANSADAAELFALAVPEPGDRRAIIDYHTSAHGELLPGSAPDESTLGRMVGKYWVALDALAALTGFLDQLRDGVPFDLELSIDEHPPEVATFDSLTSEEELAFVLVEARRRGILLTHVAPNFGVEKGTDYRCPDGLTGFEARARRLCAMSEPFGVMPDFHSGDDLSSKTRAAIHRATGGRLHFKISPMLQLIFAETLAEHDPELFRSWWEDARAYACEQAVAGSEFAAGCLRLDAERGLTTPDAHGEVFHHFSFAYVGRRDPDGSFICRERFYSLSPSFYRDYQARIARYLGGLAEDLF